MKEEFNLSDWIDKDINLLEKNDDLLKVRKVKEFIRKLKEIPIYDRGNEEIDKLAGEKLI